MRKKSIISPIADSLKLPKDLTNGDSMISLTGNEEVWIENYKGIIEYTPERIFLQLKKGKILFCGKKLHIAFYTSEEMRIIGTVEEIKFLC